LTKQECQNTEGRITPTIRVKTWHQHLRWWQLHKWHHNQPTCIRGQNHSPV